MKGNRNKEEERLLTDEEIEQYFEQYDEHAEEEDLPDARRKWMGKWIAFTLSILLLGNILAFWPQIYSLPAIQFLIKSRELSQNEHIQQYKQAVVVVKSGDSKGTGFNIAEHGLIITNQHVVAGESSNLVQFEDGSSYTAETIVEDAIHDIAILDIDGKDLPTLHLYTDGVPAQAEMPSGIHVYVIGNPLFFHGIANEGEYLGMAPIEQHEVMILQAPIYKGNSGSPVMLEDGQVIGVVYATMSMKIDGSREKVGLAVPISHVLDHLQQIEP